MTPKQVEEAIISTLVITNKQSIYRAVVKIMDLHEKEARQLILSGVRIGSRNPGIESSADQVADNLLGKTKTINHA
jgi:hypothetical protein